MSRWLAPLGAFLYLNALFTFENLPSTPDVRLVPKLSIEIVLLLAALAGLAAAGRPIPGAARWTLAAGLYVLTLVRYVDVTALGVLGRPFDLHGDFPHLHRVFAMFWEALSPATGLLVVFGFLVVSALATALGALALSAWERVFRTSAWRRAALIGGPLGLVAFLAGGTGLFASPASEIVVRQAGNLSGREAAEAVVLESDWPRPGEESALPRLAGAHVFLIFLESYGVTLIEDEHHFEGIEPRFRSLEARLREAGYRVASSQIHSPTFGGGSWRAHAALLSGVHVDSEHVYDALLASERRTLVDVMRNNGYRTVAVEPGIKWYWPDGAFYGFDAIYDFDRIRYDGPPMGWWKIPDQFSLYRLYKDEIRAAERPLFAKASLIMTHIPYYPIPRYVEDWSRFDDGTAYAAGLESVAHDAYRDLDELSSWYVHAVRYELDVLEGFLLDYVPYDSLVLLVGDHQPPKLATHDNDSWAVPMHVLSRRHELVSAFEPLGFEEGMVPLGETPLRMADFLRCFLEIFGAPGAPRATAASE